MRAAIDGAGARRGPQGPARCPRAHSRPGAGDAERDSRLQIVPAPRPMRLVDEGNGDDPLLDRQRHRGIGISDGNGGPPLNLEARKASNSNSDYAPRFWHTQRDGLRVLQCFDLRRPDLPEPPRTKPPCMAQCRLA